MQEILNTAKPIGPCQIGAISRDGLHYVLLTQICWQKQQQRMHVSNWMDYLVQQKQIQKAYHGPYR